MLASFVCYSGVFLALNMASGHSENLHYLRLNSLCRICGDRTKDNKQTEGEADRDREKQRQRVTAKLI